MPLHDWRPDCDWLFWDCRLGLLVHLRDRLDAGLLPAGCRAMIDVRPRRNDRPERRVVVGTGHQPADWVGCVEVVSPRDKQSQCRLGTLAGRVGDQLAAGRWVAVIDLLPPARYDPAGACQAVAARLGLTARGGPLTSAVFCAGEPAQANIFPAAVGQPLPALAIPVGPGRVVQRPLQAAYTQAVGPLTPDTWAARHRG